MFPTWILQVTEQKELNLNPSPDFQMPVLLHSAPFWPQRKLRSQAQRLRPWSLMEEQVGAGA